MSHPYLFYGTALGVLVLDQLSKWQVRHTFALHESRPVIEGIFHLTYVHNQGAAFGLMAHQTWSGWLFTGLALVMVILIVAYRDAILHQPSPFPLGMGLFLGGAVGNLIDRLRWQYVVDFLDFRVWPVFNVADMAVSLGTILILFQLWRMERRKPVEAPVSQEPEEGAL